MATKEEAREAADGEEVQVEAVDLGIAHLQMNLHGKLSSHEEIKDEAKTMDSTEGVLKVTEGQVSEKAPSAVEIPPEHAPNGTTSSLNGHMKEEKISNEKPQENGQNDNKHVEASSDGIRTDQSNKSNGDEAIDSLGRLESTTEDTSLLKHENEEPKEHYQQDAEGAAGEDKMVHEDTLQTDGPTVHAQQGQNLEPVEVTENTQHESTSCIPHDEVVAEAPNVDDSDALPDASYGNTETEPANVDKESFPEDEDIAEHPNEIIKLEDQPSKQTDGVDAYLVQEEVPKSKKTDGPEDMTTTEQADKLMNGDHEEVKQESPEETRDPVRGKTEETSHDESNVSASEETTPEHDATTTEPALDVQEVQRQGSAEEIEDAKEVDAEETAQQSGVAFEEATPEDNVPTIEPSSDIQHANNVESGETKGLEDAKAEETSNQSNVTNAEDAARVKEATEDIQPVQGLEEPKSTETVEMDEASNQPHANVLDNLDGEDGVPPCQPQVTELKEEVKNTGVTETQQSHAATLEELVTEDNSMAVESRKEDIQQTVEQGSVEVKDTEASETQEICHERTISASEEDSAQDDVTAEVPTSDAQEVENVEPVEEIKDNTADNIVEASNVATIEQADQENNVQASEDVSEQQTRELEPEEIQNTEPVETEEASDQSNPALLNDPPQEDSIPSDMPNTESTVEVLGTEATKTEALPQESNVSTYEEPASEENIISPYHIASTSEESTPEENVTTEPSPGTQAENLESATVTKETKYVKSTDAIAEEETPQEHVQELEAPVHTPPVEEPELEETKNTDNQMDAAILENPTHEDNPTTSESLVMESAEVSSSESTEGQEMPQSEVTQSEDHETEENTTAMEQKILEPEPADEMRDTEATEPRGISQQSIVSSSEELVPEDVTAKEPASDNKEVQTEEPELVEEHNDVKAREISNQISGTIVGETAQENLESATVTEVQEFVVPVDIPPVEEPELEETKNTEPVEVHDNVMTNDLPEEEVKDTEPIEIAEIHNESGDLTEDVKSKVALADAVAPDEDAKATEAAADMPQAQEPELEEIKNSEPVGVEDNIIASELPEEEIKDTEAMETEMIPDESASADISELTNDVKGNVALADEAAPEEHVIAAKATTDIPRAQEAELEEIKDTEPVEVEEDISTIDQPAEESKTTEAMETEEINESTDANISEPTEDAESNIPLADKTTPEEHVIATEAAVDIPRAQEPNLEEIKNTEPVEVKEDISASDLPEEEVKETEVAETEVTSESTDATISEPTENAERNVALSEEAAPEERVIPTEATVHIPRAQETELEEIENVEHVEVEENISANDLPAEEVKDTEAMKTEAINDSTDANITELTDDVALADEAIPDAHVDIPLAQEPAVQEISNTEPVEAEDSITADDVPAEEINDTEAMYTAETPHESTDDSLTASAPLADIQQTLKQEAVEDKCIDTTESQGEPQQSIVSTAAELTPTEENTMVAEPTQDTHVQNVNAEEIEGSEHARDQEFSDHSILSTAEVAAEESPLLGGDLASDVQQVLERDSTEETRGIEAVQTEDEQQHGVSNLDNPVSENNVPESEAHVANQVQEEKSAEVEDTEAMGTEEISIQVPTTENAAQESSEQGSDPDLLVQSEDSKAQLVKEEEIGQSNGAILEESTAEDNAANETNPLVDTKEECGLESVEGNKGIDAPEGEEASHPSQDAGLEELVSESTEATIEPTSDIQQVTDLDETKEMTGTEAIDGEETSSKKTEVSTSGGPSPTDDGTTPKQKDESSDLGEKTAFTTQEGESPTEEDVVQISSEDTVGMSNNIEQIKEQSEAVLEQDAVQSGDHTNDQDNKQLHNVELQMQVCERSLDVLAIEKSDEDVQKVNFDQQQNGDEAIEKQTEEIQRDEQKHDDSSTDLTTETVLVNQSSEIGTTNLHQDTDAFEAEQTETVATEMLMNEQTQHIPQRSIPSIADVKDEKSTDMEEMSEQQNAPNNTDTLYTDAEDEEESISKPSTDEHDGTIDETTNINEEVGNGLASPIKKDLQKTSDPAPSNEEMLENNPTVVPRNVEPRVQEEECINKANDDMQAIQASEEQIVDEVEEKQEMKNEDTNVSNDEIQTKSEGADEVEENKGFSSISEYVAEKSKQNDVGQDLSIHPKVVDDNSATAEQNAAEVETNSNEGMATSYTAVPEVVKFDEAIHDKATGDDGTLSGENLETFEDNRRNLEASSVVAESGESMNEDKELHNPALPAHSAVDGNTTEQAYGSEVTERGLLFPEKPLPTESVEHEESQTTNEQDEEDIHEEETGDTEKEEKEAEQSDLPVSNFLMNLIMGKQSTEPDGNLEFEAQKKQEETTKDDSCFITSKHEESLVPIPTENKVDDKLIIEQGTHDFKLESDEELSRNTHNLEAPVCKSNVEGEISSELVPGGPDLMTEVERRDIKLGEKAINSEEGSLNNNLDDAINSRASQEDTLEEGRADLRHESLPEDISSDAVAGQTLLSTEPDMGDVEKSPKDNDVQSPLSTRREQSTESSIIEAESAIEAELEKEIEKKEEKHHTPNTGGATEGQVDDNLQKGTEAISDDQTAEITEADMGTKINLVHEKEIPAGSECEEEKQSYKLSKSELDNSEKDLDIQSNGSSLLINSDKHDEFSGYQSVMEKNNLLDKPGESSLHEEQETEIGQKSPKESDGGDQNRLAIIEPVTREENVNRTVESHAQTVNTKSNEEEETFKSQVQEGDLDVVSAKEAPETEENVVVMAKPELSTAEEQIPKIDKSNMTGDNTYVEKTKNEEEAKSFTGEATTKIEEQGAVQKVSKRDLNVVLPTEAPGSEESFVDIKKPEFSTDEEESPKKYGSNMAEEKIYDEKTNGDEEAKNFTDEALTKIEEREAGQKASPKKHNILSGVGSKVKHQLAKVKKAIIGKPGHTKSDLAKS